LVLAGGDLGLEQGEFAVESLQIGVEFRALGLSVGEGGFDFVEFGTFGAFAPSDHDCTVLQAVEEFAVAFDEGSSVV